MESFDLTQKIVLVTGGAEGLGRGVAERFLDAGAEVIVCAKARPTVRVESSGREAMFMACDTRQHSEVVTLLAAIGHRYGRLDILVNYAGDSPPTEAALASPRFSRAVVETNLTAPMIVAQVANEMMQAQTHGGVMVHIARFNGLHPSPRNAAFGAAQAGLIHLTRSLAVEWAPLVRVNNVIVGPNELDGDTASANQVPLGRLASPQDVAATCVFLASEQASYISGASIEIHGGGNR